MTDDRAPFDAALDALRAWDGPIPADVLIPDTLSDAVAASLLERPVPHVADVVGRWSSWAEREGAA